MALLFSHTYHTGNPCGHSYTVQPWKEIQNHSSTVYAHCKIQKFYKDSTMEYTLLLSRGNFHSARVKTAILTYKGTCHCRLLLPSSGHFCNYWLLTNVHNNRRPYFFIYIYEHKLLVYVIYCLNTNRKWKVTRTDNNDHFMKFQQTASPNHSGTTISAWCSFSPT
jgi:hypothetical protein